LPFVTLFHTRCPEVPDNIRFAPFLKPVVGGGLGTQLRLMQGFPVAARAEHVENRSGAAAIRHTRPAATKAVGIHPYREQRRQDGP
jgi:hypothetical protein